MRDVKAPGPHCGPGALHRDCCDVPRYSSASSSLTALNTVRTARA
jgi:hypothetical protein